MTYFLLLFIIISARFHWSQLDTKIATYSAFKQIGDSAFLSLESENYESTIKELIKI